MRFLVFHWAWCWPNSRAGQAMNTSSNAELLRIVIEAARKVTVIYPQSGGPFQVFANEIDERLSAQSARNAGVVEAGWTCDFCGVGEFVRHKWHCHREPREAAPATAATTQGCEDFLRDCKTPGACDQAGHCLSETPGPAQPVSEPEKAQFKPCGGCMQRTICIADPSKCVNVFSPAPLPDASQGKTKT